jgi:hypothetical protein
MTSFSQLGNQRAAASRRSSQSGSDAQQALALAEPLEPRRLLSANLLVNPTFSAGNTGFSSQYKVGTQPGDYVVAKNPASVYAGVVSFGPPSGTGSLLLANGSTSGTAYVYHETVHVAAGTTYDFAGFATSFSQLGNDHTDPSPARLSFYVNGVAIGTFKVAATDGSFGRFADLWSSGSSTTASIKIVDRNDAATGNDFALAELSFAASPSLLVNGDFSGGYQGFSSQYIKGGTKPDDYVVAKDPASIYAGVVSFGPPGGSGQQLLANGATSGSPYVWAESVSVAKDTTYDFSGLAAAFSQLGSDHTDPSPANLAFYVNGVGIGGFKVSATDGKFGSFAASWNSGNHTGATIKIVDLNHTNSGNDFVLGDLAFNRV